MFTITIAALTATMTATIAAAPLAVPTRTVDVVDTIHGVRVPDPYRWLENSDDPEVARWTDAQNAVMRKTLDAVPGRSAIEKRLWQLYEIGSLGVPVVRSVPAHGKQKPGPRFFYTRRTGKQNQAVLYTKGGQIESNTESVLVDVNTLSADGTSSLDWWVPSEDGQFVAYGVSSNGDEESVLHVRRSEGVAAQLDDTITRTRACSLAWLPDSSGFYYTRYPAAGSVPAGEEKYHRTVFFHRLGTDPDKDPAVFGAGRDMTDWPGVTLSPDGRWLVIEVGQGWAKSEIFLIDRKKKGAPKIVPMVTGKPALFQVADVTNDRIYLLSNEGAARGKLVAVDPTRPTQKDWQEILPESPETLESAAVVGGKLAALYLKDASSRVRIATREGKPLHEVTLPGLGTAAGLSGRHTASQLYFAFTSYLTPTTIFELDVADSKPEVWAQLRSPIDASAFEVEQVRYKSKDGTSIPMFLVHRKGLVRNGQNPTLLYGYGGFNISLTPAFATSVAPYIEAGGVYAVANLRGGAEYGESWHQAGMLARKQNVFDDFIAAAEWLVAEKITSPARLAISGRSNGGLLIGATVTQRPDLFRAAICGVPLLDMVRYHKFRIAKLWIPEYGDPDKPDQFQWLWAYSPYHRVKDGTAYPATLIFTAESDTRVDAMHARKMAARMQAATASKYPILLRLETHAGHGAGKPLGKVIDQATDELAFLFSQLNMAVK